MLFKRTLAVLMALVLITLPAFLPIKIASALPTIPNPHQYRYASIAMPESLDPGWAYDTASSELMMQVYEPLIAYDHESTAAFVPMLAKSLPKVEKVTETLTNTTAVDMTKPVCSNWVSGATNYHLYGWKPLQVDVTLAVGSDNGNVYVYDKAGNLLWSYNTGAAVVSIATSFDGAYIAVGSLENKLYLFTRDGTKLWEKTVPISSGWGGGWRGKESKSVAISAHGEYVVAGCTDNLHVYKKDGTLHWSHAGKETCVGISPWGNYIVSCNNDEGTMHFFSIANSAPLWTEFIGAFWVATSNPGYVAASTGNTVYLYDKAETQIWSYSHSKWDGDYIRVDMPQDGLSVVAVNDDPSDYPGCVLCYWNHLYDGTPGWSSADNTPKWTFDPLGAPGDTDFYSVAISRNGDYVTTGPSVGSYVFSSSSNVPLVSFCMGSGLSYDLTFDGQFGACGNREGELYLFSKDSSTPLWSKTIGGIVHTVALAYSSGGLTVGDVVWFENLASHEYSFHGVVKSVSGNVVLEVERVRIYFELRTPVKFHNGEVVTTEDVEFTFERNCVLDHEGGPMWMIMRPTLGIQTTREYDLTDPAQATLVGHMIDNAFAHNTTHFWFNLVQPFPPFLQIITQSWAYVINKAWDIALQETYIPDPLKRWYGWDFPPGGYGNWLGYTNPPGPTEIDAAGQMCGTGPYKFDFLIQNDRWQISKFADYWGGWPAEGRSEDLYLDTVIMLYYEDPTLAFPLFLTDDPEVQCDSVYVPRQYMLDLIGQPCVRTWNEMHMLTLCCFVMSYDPEETSIYLPQMPIGTYKHDLFSDIHFRKAFAHLVNHTAYVQAAFLGEAIWPNSIIKEGLKYHNPDQEAYQYSLEQALDEFKLAWGGQAYAQGFKVQLIYPLGNIKKEDYCLMLEYALEVELKALDPATNFQADVSGLYYAPVYLPAMRTYQLASWVINWGANYPDPDALAKPFIHTRGAIAQFQRIQYGQSGMKQKHWDLTPWGLGTFGDPALVIDNNYVDTLIDKAVLIDDSTPAGAAMREQMYFELQGIYHKEVPGYPVYQPAGRRWERHWVQGWYFNQMSPYGDGPGGYFYHMWKGWCCHGDLDFRKDTVNGAASLNYLTCDYRDLFKFRGYYLMPAYIPCSRMRYADYNCDNSVDYIDLFRFRNYYIYYPQWSLCEGPCDWHWPPPPY